MPKVNAGFAISALAATAALAYAFAPRRGRLHAGRFQRNQVAVITGGSRGLGLALAHRFGRAGLKLVLASRSSDDLELARDGLLRSRDVQNEDDILLVEADLTDRDQCAGLIASAIATFGQVDVLINNAGIIEVGPVENQPLEAYDRAMATNFFAALHTTYAALPGMLERRSGAIVNISSIGGKLAVPHMLPYSAAKFALTGFSEGLHAEVRTKGVRVTTVCPGLLRTGGENHAKFLGNVEKEKRWFDLGAKTPGIATSAEAAADKIFAATDSGRAEITISPQAWLAARVNGLMPETTQIANSLVNRFIMPAATQPMPALAEPVIDPSPS